MRLTCALATSMETPEHIRIAESIGYERAWCYDSPALYPDVWVQLCRAAERTSTIGLGPGVLIPSLRHPMVTAAAIGTLVEIAGSGRVAVAVGSGFTGRFCMGQRPLKWADVGAYVRTVRALLAGEIVEWEGGKMQMMQPPGFGAARPIEVPFVLGAAGPKGLAVAAEIADGVFLSGPTPGVTLDWQTALFFGTVLRDGEPVGSPRVVEAAGHAASVGYHFVAEHDLPQSSIPGLDDWLHAYDDVPADERHLAMHDLHLIGVNERDRPFVTGELIQAAGYAWSPDELRERLARLEAAGVTDIAYQPAGDVPAELEAFAVAALG
ncbi:MAG: LLM class flavin-dependent oxidoreductase [Desertimonas sp.]